ncbi:MAG: pyridoxamine 5'-phosphate oxidase [Blastocatellia bacterium]|nr:pyridoxamine 5'-phosphate oxidase [Blastocatellia bacterium]
MSQKIQQRRREYVSHPFDEKDVAADPFRQFHQWFEQAVEAEQPDPEAMTLSTVNETGGISARIVLLKDCDARGFVFYTNYESRKSREMGRDGRVALTFYWSTLARQVRIEGAVERVTAEESAAYFQTRPRGSQLGAWASPQSRPIADREALETLLREAEQRFGDGPIPCPPFWGGFRVLPEQIEFWQGRESRLHDRILYTPAANAWKITRLAP